ncbi:hypothetical protein [Fibrella forsythiae]|uniref:Tip attachment protein J domain-containing protein n=1 Tax=Fibrella forsythiae TaxID=2817061 RepID=A0ABS3JDG6_9BACT|nr:hypothetical protein [Fibrella forsythiae]MBO0947488.1 hypothetical protein [Fibrella forsythiae]
MLFPFLELTFWSIPPRGYINLLPTSVEPPARQYRLRFLREATSAPAVVSVVGTESPVLIEGKDTRDIRFGEVLPQRLSVTLVTQPHWSPAAVYPNNDREVQVWLDEIVSISQVEPLFRGLLVAAAGTEEYDSISHEVTFTASCGLSTLKNRPVVTLAGTYPVGPISRLRLIEGLLAQTGLSLPLSSICNLTPINDRINPDGKDPLARLFNNGEAFRPAGEDPPSAFAVLDEFCKEMDAVLLQWGGRWWFVRVNELAGGWMPPGQLPLPGAEDVYVRDYPLPADNPDGTNGPTRRILSFTVPAGPGYTLRVAGGSKTEPQPLTPVVSVEQTWGKPKSLLDNGDFSALDGNLPAGWEKYDPAHTLFSRLGDGKPDNPFRLHIDGAGTNELGLTYQPIGLKKRVVFPAGTRSVGALRLRGKFRLKNTRAAKIVVWAVVDKKLFSGTGPDKFLLNEDGTWLYNPPRYELYGIEIENVNRVGNVVTTRTEWADFDVALNAFSVVGMQASQILYYEIGFSQANALPGAQASERWIEYAETVLIAQVENAYTGRRYTVTNQIIPASNLKRDDGDPITLKYADATFAPIGDTDTGLLMRDQAGTGYTGAFGFDKPDQANGLGGPLALWCATERAAQTAVTCQRFDGALVGELPFGPLTLVRFTDWAGSARVQLVRWSYAVAEGLWDTSALEIRRTALGLLAGAYLVEGGEIPFTPETVGGVDYTDTTPSPPKTKPPTDNGGGFLPFKPLPKYTGPILWLNSVIPVDTPAETVQAPRLSVKRGTATILELSPLVRKANEV